MELELKDRVAIVTGASRGIGRAIAETLAAEGMKLALAARTPSGLEETARRCATETLILPLDLRQAEAPAALAAAAVERFGRLDLLVNNAGATRRGDFFELTDADWQDGFALKFYGAMRLCRAVWPWLQASQGAIVNIVGIGGRTGSAEFTIGGAVNAALLNLTKALAERGVHDGVRVNAINPGSIATERLQTRIQSLAAGQGLSLEQAAQTMAHKLGVGRFGEPQEIARAVAFLASPAASYCQGVIFDVDGGQTRTL